MANPYHDEYGRFCSKNGMTEAIERLQKNGDFEGYFTLRKEYEDIESQEITVSKNFLSNLTVNFSQFGNYVDGDDITDVFYANKDAIYRGDEKAQNVSYAIIKNSQIPDDVRQDLISNAGLGIKRYLMKRNSDYVGQDFLLPSDVFLMVESENDPELLRSTMYSGVLTFEQKYELASRYPEGLLDLCNRESEKFLSVDELKEELIDQADVLLNSGEETQFNYLLALSSFKDNKGNQIVLDNASSNFSEGKVALTDGYGYSSPLSKLVENNFLNPTQAKFVANELLFNDVHGMYVFYQNKRYYFITENSFSTKFLSPGQAEHDPKISEVWGMVNNLNNKDSLTMNEAKTLQSCQSYIDSYSDNYKALQNEYKKAQKLFSNKNSAEDDRTRFFDLKRRVEDVRWTLRAKKFISQMEG